MATSMPIMDALEINHSVPICKSESFLEVQEEADTDEKESGAVCECYGNDDFDDDDGKLMKRRCGRTCNEFVKFVKKVCSLVQTHLGLFILLMGYTFLGGAVMDLVEDRTGKAQAQSAAPDTMNISRDTNESDFRRHFIETLKNSYSELSTMDDLVVAQILKDYEKELAYFKDNRDDLDIDYWSWVLFCLTVYSTIGYGHIVPKTRAGRICTMAYATIGIPLFLMTMHKLGKLFTLWLKRFYNVMRRCYYSKPLRCLRRNKVVRTVGGGMSRCLKKTSLGKKSTGPGDELQISSRKRKLLRIELGESVHCPLKDESDMDDDDESYKSIVIDSNFNLNPIVAIIITAFYIVLGAALYPIWEEDWNYHKAFYFIFISLSTIGFGDLVPKHPKFFLLSSIYIMLGLALVAMVINVLVQFFKETAQHITEEIHTFKWGESFYIKSAIARMHHLNGEGIGRRKRRVSI